MTHRLSASFLVPCKLVAVVGHSALLSMPPPVLDLPCPAPNARLVHVETGEGRPWCGAWVCPPCMGGTRQRGQEEGCRHLSGHVPGRLPEPANAAPIQVSRISSHPGPSRAAAAAPPRLTRARRLSCLVGGAAVGPNAAWKTGVVTPGPGPGSPADACTQCRPGPGRTRDPGRAAAADVARAAAVAGWPGGRARTAWAQAGCSAGRGGWPARHVQRAVGLAKA
jgi:hypothetical protein